MHPGKSIAAVARQKAVAERLGAGAALAGAIPLPSEHPRSADSRGYAAAGRSKFRSVIQ